MLGSVHPVSGAPELGPWLLVSKRSRHLVTILRAADRSHRAHPCAVGKYSEMPLFVRRERQPVHMLPTGVASRGVTSRASYQNEATAPAPMGGWIESDSGIALDANVTNMLRSQVVVLWGRSMSLNVVIP